MGNSNSNLKEEITKYYPTKHTHLSRRGNYIENLYDVDTGEILELTKLKEIYDSQSYYFHGTSFCRLFQVLNDGFDVNEIHSSPLLGIGVYLADNLNYALYYGSCILICTAKLNNVLQIPFHGDLDDIDDHKKYDTIYQLGQIDRFDNKNEKDKGFFRYNEVLVRDAKNVKIKYVLVSTFTPQDLFSRDKVYIKCVLDLKSNKTYDRKNMNPEEEKKYGEHNLWYIRVNFQTMLNFINSKLEINNSDDGIKISTKNLPFFATSNDVYKRFVYSYILAAEILDENSQKIIPVPPKAAIHSNGKLNYEIIPHYLLFLGF